jgi:outer membrane protein OmpA-like peptidoglycan-associated protein
MMRAFILILAIAASAPSLAQPMKNVSVDQLVEQLAGPEQPKTRSLRNLKPEPRSIDLVIQFDFDSAKLQENSKPLLDNLVAAMKNDRLMSVRFKVEGHTDAKGSEAYNQNLSMRRAESVVNYMADKGIEKERMEGIGKGFSDLLYPDKPQAMENRRVRITTLQ